MNLYTLTGNYMDIQRMIEEGEDEAKFTDTLESLEDAIEDKAEAYFYIIRNVESDIESIKAEEKRLADKRRAAENKMRRLKDNLQYSMEAVDKPKIKTPLFTANIQKNAPSVDVFNEELIPRSYYEAKEPQLNKKALLTALKDGQDIPGASIKQTESLRLR